MAANPELKGKRFMHIFEATVEATEPRNGGWGGLGWVVVGVGWVGWCSWVGLRCRSPPSSLLSVRGNFL